MLVFGPAEGGSRLVTVLMDVDRNVFAGRMLMNMCIAVVRTSALINNSEVTVFNLLQIDGLKFTDKAFSLMF